MSIIEDALEAYARSLREEGNSLRERIDGLYDTLQLRSDRIYTLEESARRADEHHARLQATIDSLRAEVDRLGAIVGGSFDWGSVVGLDKIPAIKAYREATGLGLKDSKDAVDAAEKDGRYVRPAFPGTFVATN